MPGVILAFLEQPEAVERLLAAAERLSERMGGARIDALAVRVPPELTIVPGEEVIPPHAAARLRLGEIERVEAVRAAVDAWAGRLHRGGDRLRWCEAEGLVSQILRDQGLRADVIVLPRPQTPEVPGGQSPVHAALFATDRPVLVVPPGPVTDFGRCVAIAWRDERPATRAVLSALRTGTVPEKTFVLAGIRPGETAPQAPAILSEHGISAELRVLGVGPGVFGETLLAQAHHLGADLIVMGAYRHSLLREFLLGGLTRFMLAHSDLPVLMRH
jgi:nucleotide-binding universal stress UspA family protein